MCVCFLKPTTYDSSPNDSDLIGMKCGLVIGSQGSFTVQLGLSPTYLLGDQLTQFLNSLAAQDWGEGGGGGGGEGS